MSLENEVSISESNTEIFVPGRLCILGEHSDWAAEYRTANPSISFGEYIKFVCRVWEVSILTMLNMNGCVLSTSTLHTVRGEKRGFQSLK
jgi:galactokinase